MRFIVLSITLLIVVGVSYNLFIILGGTEFYNQTWPGYYIIKIQEKEFSGLEESRNTEKIISLLLSANIGPIISSHTSTVAITNFNDYETILVRDLDARLDQLDPRYDPFLKRINEWFVEEQNEIIFVHSNLPLINFAFKIAIALNGFDATWKIVELNLIRDLCGVCVLIILVFISFFLRFNEFNAIWFLSVIPWLMILFNCGIIIFSIVIPLYFCISWIVIPLKSKLFNGSFSYRQYPEQGSISLRLVLFVVLICLIIGSFLIPVFRLVAVYCLAGILGQFIISLLISYFFPELIKFRPLEILTTRNYLRIKSAFPDSFRISFLAKSEKKKHGFLLLAIIGLLLGTLALQFAFHRSNEFYPMPSYLNITDKISYSNLRLLESQRISTAENLEIGNISSKESLILPGLSLYVSHIAYQSSLKYGREFILPSMEEVVTLPKYSQLEDGRIDEQNQEQLRFSDEWLQEELEELSEESLGKLLLAGNRINFGVRGVKSLISNFELLIWTGNIIITLILTLFKNKWESIIIRISIFSIINWRKFVKCLQTLLIFLDQKLIRRSYQ